MKRKKYKFGTSIESPSTALAKNQQAIAKADLESTNWLTDALDFVGNAAMSTGMQMLTKAGGQALSNIGGQKIDTVLPGAIVEKMTDEDRLGFSGTYALGGTVPVEVEGGESANLPNGKTVEFKGASHSKGGIDTNLPSGTEIFSDRISLDGMTMGERNAYRGRKLKKLSSLASNSEPDKNTFERTKKSFEIDKENDLLLQSLIKSSTEVGSDKLKMALGGKIMDTISGFGENLLGTLDGMTAGDLLGMYSNFRKGTSGLKNTQAHRAGQTPNINPYEDYGKQSLQTLDSAIQFSDDILAQNISDIQNQSLNLRARNRAGARGVNTQRALDISSSVAATDATNRAYQGHRGTLMDMLTRQSQLEANIDDKVMTGEYMRDMEDRNDYDAYYTNRGRDLQSFFESLSQIGGNMNRMKERDVQETLLNSLSKYFDIDVNTGKLTKKANG